MDKKNQKVQYGLLTDTSMKLESNLKKQRALKRELLLKDQSEETNKTKSELKKGLKRYKNKIAGESSSSSDEEKEVTGSQKEFYDKMIEIEKNINQAKRQQAFTRLEIERLQEQHGNKENVEIIN